MYGGQYKKYENALLEKDTRAVYASVYGVYANESNMAHSLCCSRNHDKKPCKKGELKGRGDAFGAQGAAAAEQWVQAKRCCI